MTGTERTAEPGFLAPRVWIPFMVTSLIWGSTWLVIRDQLGTVPATWSVTYRFIVAAIGTFILALVMRQSLKMTGRWSVGRCCLACCNSG